MYILPQVQLFQEFRTVPTATVQNLNAFVFGPNYALFRYAEADERQLIGIGQYDPGSDEVFAYPNKPAGSTVDTGYVALFMENLLAQYATITGVPNLVVQSDLNKVRLPNHVLVTANGYNCTPAVFRTRGVRVGDRVRYTIATVSETFEGITRVVGFEADAVAAVVEDPTADAGNSTPGLLTNDLVKGSLADYAGPADTTYVVEVLNSGVFTRAVSLKTDHAYTSELYTLVCTTAGALDGTAIFSVTSNIQGSLTAIDPSAGVPKAIGGRGLDIVFNDVTISGETPVDPMVGDVVYVEVTGTGVTVTYSRVGASNFEVADNATSWDDAGAVGTGSVSAQGISGSDWANWTGGNNDDTYTLVCTTAGTHTTARFAVTSTRGDNQTAIDYSSGTATATGTRGLVVTMTAGDYIVGDRWLIKVQAARPRISVMDAAGVDVGSQLYAAASGNVIGSYGVMLDFNDNSTNAAGTENANGVAGVGLTAGDRYYVAVSAEADGAVRTAVLADDLPDAGQVGGGATSFQVWFYIYQAAAEIGSERTQAQGDFNWTATTAEFTTKAGLQVRDASWGLTELDWLNVYSADMYLQYRALVRTAATTISSIGDISDVANVLGAIHPDNPLAQGVYNALLNSGDRVVYYMATPTDNLAGYNAVLDKASLTDNVYHFAPLTRSSTILAAIEAHINAMSSETRKAWRYGVFARDVPVETAIYDLAHNPASEEFYATIAADKVTLTFTRQDGSVSPYTNALSDLRYGDIVRINFGTDAWGNASYTELTVDEAVTNTVITLLEAAAAEITVPVKVEVWHPYTTDEIAAAFAALASAYANRRISVVFPGSFYMEGVLQTSEFACAALAGLASSVAPQQGLTNIELNGFDDVPAVYSQFNATQLDTIAEGGTLIVMQNVPGGPVYVRHQLTTAALEGNLNKTEWSVTKNVDSVSYYLANILQSYTGRYNVTPEMVALIRTELQDGINFLGSLTNVGILGPQLILDDLQGNKTEIVTCIQHPTFRDRIYVVINLAVPYPINNIETHLVV